MKVGGIETWKELTIGVQQLVWLLLRIMLSSPDLSFNTRQIEKCLQAECEGEVKVKLQLLAPSAGIAEIAKR